MKSPLIIIITVTLLLLAAGAGYLIHNKPPATEMTKVTAPVELSTMPRESKPSTQPPPPSFEQKLESLKKAIADVSNTGERRELTLVFTEKEANDQLALWLSKAEMPADIPLKIKSAQIDFQQDNKVLTEANGVVYNRFNLTIKAVAQVSIKESKPSLEITKLSFGFVPLPQSLKDKIASLIKAKIDNLPGQLTEAGFDGRVTLKFKDITIRQDELITTVVIEPKT